MRRQVATATQGISLFPFLAVLLCTMGALIVVLVVLNRQSRLQAAALTSREDHSRSEKEKNDVKVRRQMAEWRLQLLRESREKTQTELDHQRLRLSGVEEHRRLLETQLKNLQLAATELEKHHPGQATGRAAEELRQLNVEIERAKRELTEIQAVAANRAPAYSVVAYDGPNRTSRRPIYIECSADRVVIQPEGIVLSAEDFAGPMGPGNPLASAIRAARDHLAAVAPDLKSPTAEPYPLFLVRPDGIEAYYAARAAMQSWGADFGYQTVDEDWQLEFPAVDARLAEIERQAVEEARDRLQWLAQMNPGRYGGDGTRDGAGDSGGSGGKAVYHVSPLGGLVRDGGPTLKAGSARFSRTANTGRGASGSPRRRPGTGSASPNASNDISDMAIGPQSSSPLPGTTKDRASKQSNDRSAAARSLANGTEKERRYGDLNDQASSRDSLAADAGKPAIDSADIDPNGEPAEMKTPKQPRQKPRSLAETRGANWGLSPSARASNPITRPIHIVCEGDRLLVHPEQPSDSAVVVPLRQRTDDSVDQLVSEVQKRIEHWGLAGRGLYWRPQLILEVGHSGEGRYADLEALLADSGFDVKRR